MACRLFGAKPLSEQILKYFVGSLKTNFSEVLIEIRTFSFKKMHLKNFVCKMTAISYQPHCVKEIKSFIGPWQQYIQYGATWKYVEQSNDVVELTTHTTCLSIASDHVWVYTVMEINTPRKIFWETIKS